MFFRKALALIAIFTVLLVQSPSSQAATFNDVAPSDWFYAHVEQLAQAGIVSSGNSNFFPYRTLSRAELAKMAVLGSKSVNIFRSETYNTATFCDVRNSDWSFQYVETLVAHNVVSGINSNCSQGKIYLPNNPISRAEALKILLGSFNIAPQGTSTRFYDVDSNFWYSSYIAKATDMGLVNGYNDGSFRPNGLISRAEMSKILSKLLQLTTEQTPSPSPTPTVTATPHNSQQLSYNIGSPSVHDYWIATNGNDSNPGTQAQPFRTFSHAWSLVPLNTQLSTGFRFHVLSGAYSAPDLYIEDRLGTATAPVIFQGEGSVSINGNFNSRNLKYIYFINLAFTSPNDVMHFELGDHILLRNITLRSPGRSAQETLKVNQTQYIYIEDSDIAGAHDNAIDFVAVQYGHVVRSQIHDSEDWCMYTKGGSAYLRVEGNEYYDCGTGGFTAGQGTGFEYMTAPWLHYEAYDIRFVNNIIHDTEGAGIGVNGGYNILMAHNTMYKVGSRDHVVEVVFGSRSCDGETANCTTHRAQGGWGPSTTGSEVFIGNKHVRILNNVIYNPDSAAAQIFAIYAPRPTPTGSNAPNPAVTDSDLIIAGNVIWNGDNSTPLGIGDEQGCRDSNPTCNAAQLIANNAINNQEPDLVSPDGGNFSLANKRDYSSLAIALPTFSWSDLPATPMIPTTTTVTNIPYTYYRDSSLVSTNFPGAY